MAYTFKLSLIQTTPRPDFASALDEILPFLEQAADQGAQLIATPEYCGGLKTINGKLAPPAAPESSHPVLRALQAFAERRKVWLLVGSIAVERPDEKFFNRGFVIDANGRITGRYDKIHLFDVQLSGSEIYQESASIHPGRKAHLAHTPFGAIGFTICYELRFPGLYRQLSQAGAELLTVPAAFTRTTGRAHWHILNRARAIENGCYVFSPCATGPVPGGGETYGHSLVVDPWGRVVADAGGFPGVATVRVDLHQVADARRRIPSLTHDREYEPPVPLKSAAA